MLVSQTAGFETKADIDEACQTVEPPNPHVFVSPGRSACVSLAFMATAAEIVVGTVVELFFATCAMAVLYRVYGWFFPVPKRQVVSAFQRGVVLVDGRAEKVLGPGAYWISPKRRMLLCDVRPTPFQVPSHELVTSDGMAVRISLGGEYRISSPAQFVTESSDAFGTFYLEVRQTLRAATGELTSNGLLTGQSLLSNRVKELLIPTATQLGIEVARLEVYEAVPVGWLRPI